MDVDPAIVEEGNFELSSTEWSSFTIHLSNYDDDTSDEFVAWEGTIAYGQTVRLVDEASDQRLPRLVRLLRCSSGA